VVDAAVDERVARIDCAALQATIAAQGVSFGAALLADHAHLFADVALTISADQIAQMQAVIAAVEEVVQRPAWEQSSYAKDSALGVFYGYDFHLNVQGAHLIEINTNAGGAFLNALLIASQRGADLSGKPAAADNLEQIFLETFRNEWRLEHGNAPLKTIAIVDEQSETQYLYPEFLLAQNMFERAGIAAHIVAPSSLQPGADGLYVGTQKIDLIYNRLTDFSLQRYPHIHSAWEQRHVVLTPNPVHYQRYADKRRLLQLADAAWLHSAGVSEGSMQALLRHVPPARLVREVDAESWWQERKNWFFKPVSGYGSKGAYRGDKLTRRVFDEVMQSGDYIAQQLAMPGECAVPDESGEVRSLKYDVRCYVYEGRIQLVAARLYQGQTTNFRTPGGGFAVVRVAE
jgi:hypothetical protein